MITQTDEVTWALARANIYNFLATVYAEPPTGCLLDGLCGGAVEQALATVADGVRVEELAAWARGRDRRAVQQELALEYTRLFVGPSQGYVPPYESVHVDTRQAYYGLNGSSQPPDDRLARLLFGPSTLAVQQAYAAAGLAIAPDQGELPDHISLELQFMHHLCNREAEAWNQNNVNQALEWRQHQRFFLTRHLRVWVPGFCAQIQAATDHPFYQVVAAVTAIFVENDMEELTM